MKASLSLRGRDQIPNPSMFHRGEAQGTHTLEHRREGKCIHVGAFAAFSFEPSLYMA